MALCVLLGAILAHRPSISHRYSNASSLAIVDSLRFTPPLGSGHELTVVRFSICMLGFSIALAYISRRLWLNWLLPHWMYFGRQSLVLALGVAGGIGLRTCRFGNYARFHTNMIIRWLFLAYGLIGIVYGIQQSWPHTWGFFSGILFAAVAIASRNHKLAKKRLRQRLMTHCWATDAGYRWTND